MPANAADIADDAKNGAATAGTRMTAEAQRSFADARARIEQAVQDGLEQLRTQSRVYADTAGEQIDQAQQYVTERVRERPIAAIGAAVGVGVLVGLLLSAGRK
jgi:ElaB/YqjD/DUF883 family membrane-anchored ribosome-binding protein